MPKTIRNQFDKKLTYENLMIAHQKSRNGKTCKESIVKFEMKKEEYLLWLYNKLKTQTYKHGVYKCFYVYEPKLRKIEAARYIDRIVHRWYVDNFIEPYFVPCFIQDTYACLKNRGMHKCALGVQKAMKKAKKKWGDYYILKMDVSK